MIQPATKSPSFPLSLYPVPRTKPDLLDAYTASSELFKQKESELPFM